jgi:high-affinity iron transporter
MYTRQIWLGTLVGVLAVLTMGAVIIGGFRAVADETFGAAEDLWEAIFSLVASVIITITGAVLLRVGKLQAKWGAKLSRAVQERESGATVGADTRKKSFFGRYTAVGENYALFLLPLITILREGLEGVLFIAGVVLGSPASSIPLSVLAGIVVGILISFVIYK